MSSADPRRLSRAIRRLTAAVSARSSEAADARLYRFAQTAVRSAKNLDAAFAAVQRLRDLESIDHAEAAYLFGQLFEHHNDIERESDEPDPDLARALEENVEHELIMAAMGDNDLASAVAFHRERGESELAEMMVNQADEYSTLCADGQLSLIDDKPPAEKATDQASPPATTHALSERVLALSATESIREWLPAWQALCAELRNAEPAAAVAAIQSVRDVGGISFDESLVLIDMAIDPLVDDALAADREYHRLERAIEECKRQLGIEEGDGAADETRPLAWRALHLRRSRRIEGITAVILRRFGEHRLANLLTMKPEEYARIRDEVGVGGSGKTAP